MRSTLEAKLEAITADRDPRITTGWAGSLFLEMDDVGNGPFEFAVSPNEAAELIASGKARDAR